MRKLAIAMALASTAIAGPALARNDAFYIGANGGAMIVEDVQFDIRTAAPSRGTVDLDYGYDVDGVIGYDFGMFRLEAEVAYKEADVDNYRATGTTFRGTTLAGFAPAGSGAGRGRLSALSFMANALLDFGDDDGIQGFVGGGAGVARVKASNFSISGAGNFLNDSDTRFAYQAIAGVRAPLGDHLDVSLKYRFFNVEDVRLVNVQGVQTNGRFRSHSILGGVTYNFGEPPAPVVAPPPPPPYVAPPPPPPPPAVVCTPGPFIVFFEWDKSDITPEAASILDNAVAAYGNCGQAQVELRGYTDTSGTPRYNLGLSQRRADAVSSYMQSRGVGSSVISTQALGETNLRVQTADGVRELQNRRVEIMYGAGAGM